MKNAVIENAAVLFKIMVDIKEMIFKAKVVLGGQVSEPQEILKLANELLQIREFGYARKLFNLARNAQHAEWNDHERLYIAQKLAYSTYNDPDLPSDQKYAWALDLLSRECNLNEDDMYNRTTLGLAGAIYRHRWECEGHIRFLEKSCHYYLRGCQNGIAQSLDENPGYNEINAAFGLDLMADLEARVTNDNSDHLESVSLRRTKAKELRQRTLTDLGAMIEHDFRIASNLWVLVTMAEACYGIGRYEEGDTWLRKAFQSKGISSLQMFSIIRQFVRLVELTSKHDTKAVLRRLVSVLEESAVLQISEEAIRDISAGKVGLALSGDGFRASLFHIGVL